MISFFSFSFNSYGEWTELGEEDDGIYYIDLDTIKEHDGYVYWWNMINLSKPDDGMMSVRAYFQGDCGITRAKFLTAIASTKPMGEGELETETPSNPEWHYSSPDSVGGYLLDFACNWIETPPEEQQKLIEEIQEYNRQSEQDDSSYSLSSKSFPPNAYPSGNSWKCNIGYERYNNGCRPEVIVREEQQKKNELEEERAAEKLAFEKEQYNRLLTEAVQAEEDLARQLIIEDQLNTLKSAYVNNIAARIRSYWNYQGADDDWGCEVYVLQDGDGNVQAVDVQSCTLDDSSQARAFKNSIERAVYKASPLPVAPDDAVFDREILFEFRIN